LSGSSWKEEGEGFSKFADLGSMGSIPDNLHVLRLAMERIQSAATPDAVRHKIIG